MAWPPPTLATTRTNQDPQQDVHPADHNTLATALNDTVSRIDKTVSAMKGQHPGGSIGNATWVRVAPQTAEWQVGPGLRIDTNGIITDLGGLILFSALIHWPTSSGNGRRIAGLSTSTSATPTAQYQSSERGVTNQQAQHILIPYKAATVSGGTRLNLWVYQDSGATLSLTVRKVTVMRLTHAW